MGLTSWLPVHWCLHPRRHTGRIWNRRLAGESNPGVFHLRTQGLQWLLDESDASGFGVEAQNSGFRGENCKSDSPLDPCVDILWTRHKPLYFAGMLKCFSVSWRQTASPCTSGSEYRAAIKCTIPVVPFRPCLILHRGFMALFCEVKLHSPPSCVPALTLASWLQTFSS